MLDPTSWAPRGGAVALLLTLGACSSDAGGPSDQVLVGTWGSEAAEFVAIQAGAEVRTGCTTTVIHSPVTLTEANTFATRGELHRDSVAGCHVWAANLSHLAVDAVPRWGQASRES